MIIKIGQKYLTLTTKFLSLFMPQNQTALLNNTIYLRRKLKVFVAGENSQIKKAHIGAFLANIKSLGFTCSNELIAAISRLSVDQLKEFYDQLVMDLKEMLGANVEYQPMYPNFPWQLRLAIDTELYLNATMHYLGDWIGERIFPAYQKEKRNRLQDSIALKVIELGSPEEFVAMFSTILRAKVAMTATDRSDLEWFINAYKDDVLPSLPIEIPSKENLAILVAYLLEYATVSYEIIGQYVKTATDVLRLAVALSKGDLSLAENSKFRTFSKKERRKLLALLEGCKMITEDMLRFKEQWKRLGEKLHPFEYRKKYAKCFEAFDIIRNDKPFVTFNSKIESSLRNRDIDLTTDLLKSRPGEYARRLDHMLRLTDDHNVVIETFREIAMQVSSPVLLQLLAHFKSRNDPAELRTFFPKGNFFQAKAIAYDLPEIKHEVCAEIIDICETALIEKYQRLPALGPCYIGEELKDFTVPFALRSASKALKTISRGSKIDLPDGDTLRFFIWWKDGQQRTDLDLSAIGLDKNHKYVTEIAYYNLKSMGGSHSGDITSAPNGASEFIDVDMRNFLDAGIHFLLMSVTSFTNQPFYELPECFAGFMMRQAPDSGEIYEPNTVLNKFDLTANSKMSIPLMIDLLERKVYWTDISLKVNPYFHNNVYNNMSSITIIAKSMMSLRKPNLHDLFSLHVKARGEIVTNIKHAKHIFALDSGITPYHMEEIIADYI